MTEQLVILDPCAVCGNGQIPNQPETHCHECGIPLCGWCRRSSWSAPTQSEPLMLDWVRCPSCCHRLTQWDGPQEVELRCVDCRKQMRPGYRIKTEWCGGHVTYNPAWSLCEDCAREH